MKAYRSWLPKGINGKALTAFDGTTMLVYNHSLQTVTRFEPRVFPPSSPQAPEGTQQAWPGKGLCLSTFWVRASWCSRQVSWCHRVHVYEASVFLSYNPSYTLQKRLYLFLCCSLIKRVLRYATSFSTKLTYLTLLTFLNVLYVFLCGRILTALQPF